MWRNHVGGAATKSSSGEEYVCRAGQSTVAARADRLRRICRLSWESRWKGRQGRETRRATSRYGVPVPRAVPRRATPVPSPPWCWMEAHSAELRGAEPAEPCPGTAGRAEPSRGGALNLALELSCLRSQRITVSRRLARVPGTSGKWKMEKTSRCVSADGWDRRSLHSALRPKFVATNSGDRTEPCA